MKAIERRSPRGQRIEVWCPDVGAERTEMAEARVVEHDDDDVGSACRRLGLVWEPWHRLRRGKADLLWLVHEMRG